MLRKKNENYMILLMELEEYETDVLFEHTRRRRQGFDPTRLEIEETNPLFEGATNEAQFSDIAKDITSSKLSEDCYNVTLMEFVGNDDYRSSSIYRNRLGRSRSRSDKEMEEEARFQAENLVNALKALQAGEKSTDTVATEKDQKYQKMQAESDKIASLLAKFEEERLARDEAAAAKPAQEKAEAENKAAHERELTAAAEAVRERDVKGVANAAANTPLQDLKTTIHSLKGR